MEKYCKNCGEKLADTKRSHAVFCTVTCKKAAEHKRRISNAEKRELNRLRSKAWREANKERSKKKVSDWQKLNRHRCAANGMKYLAAKRSATPSWLTKEMEGQIQEIYWLAQDLSKVSPDRYHVDHIVPIQGENICGLHVPWNLQVLPSDINISKGNRPFSQLGKAGGVYYDPDTTLLEETTWPEGLAA